MSKQESPSQILQVMQNDIQITNDNASGIRFSNIENTARGLFEILLDRPSELVFGWTIADGEVFTLTIHTHPEDIKKMIGRDGATINAMRTIFHAAFARLGKRSRIVVEG